MPMIHYSLTTFCHRYKRVCPESSALCFPMCEHLRLIWMQMSHWICSERRQKNVQRWDTHVQGHLSQGALTLSMMGGVPPKLPIRRGRLGIGEHCCSPWIILGLSLLPFLLNCSLKLSRGLHYRSFLVHHALHACDMPAILQGVKI